MYILYWRRETSWRVRPTENQTRGKERGERKGLYSAAGNVTESRRGISKRGGGAATSVSFRHVALPFSTSGVCSLLPAPHFLEKPRTRRGTFHPRSLPPGGWDFPRDNFLAYIQSRQELPGSRRVAFRHFTELEWDRRSEYKLDPLIFFSLRKSVINSSPLQAHRPLKRH